MDFRQEALGIAVTVPRLLLVVEMTERIKQQKPIAVPMAAFIVADVADGVFMRLIGGARRRLQGEF